MKFHYVLVIGLVLGLLGFLFWMNQQATVVTANSEADTVKITHNKTAIETKNRSVSSVDTTQLMQEHQVKSQLYSLRLSPVEAEQKFRHSRNYWMADPSLAEDEKHRLIDELAMYLWGEDADIPEASEADIEQQEQIRQRILVFREQIQMLKDDPAMDLEQKQQEIARLMNNFIAEGEK